jgi:hypothetical protein
MPVHTRTQLLAAGGGRVGARVRRADLTDKVLWRAGAGAVVPDAAVSDALFAPVDHHRARFAEQEGVEKDAGERRKRRISGGPLLLQRATHMHTHIHTYIHMD